MTANTQHDPATSTPSSRPDLEAISSSPRGESATQKVLDKHLGCFAAGDLDGIMADYVAASVLFTTDGPLFGPGAIRDFMARLFAEFAKPGARFTMHTMTVAHDVGFIVWSAETADNRYELATDTFVVRDGKILFQSYVGKVVPRRLAAGA